MYIRSTMSSAVRSIDFDEFSRIGNFFLHPLTLYGWKVRYGFDRRSFEFLG